jgi:SNF2 family DNA or RNA helicase
MLLLDIVENIIESGEKVLIFTQFKEMGRFASRIY